MDSQCCLSSNHIHLLRRTTTTTAQHHYPFLQKILNPAATASTAKKSKPCSSGIITTSCTLVNPKISVLTHDPILLPPRETFRFRLPSPLPAEHESLATDPPPIRVSHDSLKYASGYLGVTKTQETRPGSSVGPGEVHSAMSYLTKILSSNVYDVAVETPLEYAPKLSGRSGVHLWLKREDLQPVFSFKLRGAYNIMAKLTKEQLAKGVICSSAGNHAQGVALAAQRLRCNATIIMPVTTPEIKWKAVERLGGKVVLVGESYDEAEAYAKRKAEEEGIAFVPPFDHPDVIAGQGTIGMEIIRQFSGSSLHAIFVPVGGGGLIAGIAAYVKRVRPDVKVIGVEPYDANAMALSLHHGQRVILDHVGGFAGGVAVKSVGKETFSMCKELIDGVVLVGRDSICASIKDMFEEKRSILEPAGALALAGAEAYCKYYGLKGESVVAIASGANMNFDRLRLVTQLADVGRQREAVLAAFLPERKGMFKQFRELVGPINITEFKYRYDAQREEALVLFSVGVHTSSELGHMLHRFKSAQLWTINLTDNELVKDHLQHLVGGRSDVENELLCRFIIPERPGAFAKFLEAFCPRYNISLFHYRSQGDSGANVLTGFQVASSEMDEFKAVAEGLGFAYEFEMNNEALQLLMH